jgi:hypothetical protein
MVEIGVNPFLPAPITWTKPRLLPKAAGEANPHLE